MEIVFRKPVTRRWNRILYDTLKPSFKPLIAPHMISKTNNDPTVRMKSYIEKIAAGPRMSKNLTEQEAEDALSLILSQSVSETRAAVFLIAARMKLETLDENIGYWRALNATCESVSVPLPRLLQIADPFDGVTRWPYFGFYAIPLIAALGLPVYGHSSAPAAPKFGVTFEDLLIGHYQIPASPVEIARERRLRALENFKFSYLSLRHSHPQLDRMASLRSEIVKRTTLSTLEKLLIPLKAEENFLASTYFHKGYEIPMTAIAALAGFDTAVIGNGMEGTSLYGVHKPARLFRTVGTTSPEEILFDAGKTFAPETAKTISDACAEIKNLPAAAPAIVQFGEEALESGSGPRRR